MTEQEINEILRKQKEFFNSGATLNVDRRLYMLAKLKKTVLKYENDIIDALHKDLGKSTSESFMCEIGMTLSEITYMQKHLKRFSKEQHIVTPLAQYISRSFTKPVPYGNVLIMSPWNYPVLLTLEPLIDAIAAGNTCIVKPSAYSPASTLVLCKIINECFDEKYVAIVTGGRAENSCLLDQKFDYIFFTGSQTVGKEVLKKAACHLTPVTLELGGKSPVIVDKSANLKVSAKRIVFGKFLNCGQTCVAPDYIYCHKSVKDKLVKYILSEIKRQYGNYPLMNPDYGKMINEKHFNRVLGLIDKEKLIYGGRFDRDDLRIEPTVMDNVTWDDAIMKEEIFGPVLPILTYTDERRIIKLINDKPHPLAAYCFSSDKMRINYFKAKLQFGGGCINDTIIHLATQNMGFGGVGASGMGSYHGKEGFETFSHRKSIVDKKLWPDLPMRYQPYSKFTDKLVKMFLK